jgi:4-hydroxybutyrate CoA-transferase
MEAGIINNQRKGQHSGRSVGTFFLGTDRLYAYIDDNPSIEAHPASYCNHFDVIRRNSRQVSINSILGVDLTGQCAAESIGPKQYSGPGGQVDFVRGAQASQGGKAILVLRSTRKNGSLSNIVSSLPLGAVVTTARTDVQYVVTEFGVANLKGKTASARARELIAISHPDFRDPLLSEARRLGVL